MAKIRPSDFTVSGQIERGIVKRLKNQIAKERADLHKAIFDLRTARGVKETAHITLGRQRVQLKYYLNELKIEKTRGNHKAIAFYERRIDAVKIEVNETIKTIKSIGGLESDLNKRIARIRKKIPLLISQIRKITAIGKIPEYINYAVRVIKLLEREYVSEFKSQVLQSIPLTIEPYIMDHNKEQFERILKQYVKVTRLTVAEAVNKKALNVALKALKKPRVKRSLRPTQRAMDTLMRAEYMRKLPDWRKGKEGETITTIRAIRIFWLRQKGLLGKKPYNKDNHGELKPRKYSGQQYVPENEQDARIEIKKKIAGIQRTRLGWYKRGFLEMAGVLAPHVPGDKFRYNRSRGQAGDAKPARAGSRPTAILYHKAPWARRAALPAINEALVEEAGDMEKYIMRKLAKSASAASLIPSLLLRKN